jgi:hypothetical protein
MPLFLFLSNETTLELIMRYHYRNPRFYFECSGLVWYATAYPCGDFTRISLRDGHIYRT